MVKKLSIFLGYSTFFILSVIYFTPKVALYYLAEKELKKFDVVVSNEEAVDNGFSLELRELDVTLKAIESANIEELNIKLFLLYNSLSMKNITLSQTASSFVPLNIYIAEAKYTILNPLNATASASGDFGELELSFNIAEMALNIKLFPSAEMLKSYRGTMSQLVKNEDGSYSYDKTF